MRGQELRGIPDTAALPCCTAVFPQGIRQLGEVFVAAELYDPQTGQMWGTPLHIQESDACASQLSDKPQQRHLRGVPTPLGVVEHRLPGEQPADLHPVQPADEPTLGIPGLDAVNIACLVKRGVGEGDPVINPAALPVGIAAGRQDVGKGLVGSSGVAGGRLAQ